MATIKLKQRRGGARSNSGRPPKIDKELWGQITCVLKNDTIAQLRAGAASRFFGEFLQHHLDRFPPPSREQYLYMQQRGGKLNLTIRRHYPKVRRTGRAPSAASGSPNFSEAFRDLFNPSPAKHHKELTWKGKANDRPRKGVARRAVSHKKR